MEAANKQKNINGKTEGMVQTKTMDKTQNKTMDKAQMVDSASMGEDMDKMSILKKWWFWVAVGAGVLILAFIVWFFLF